MEFVETPLQGLYVIHPRILQDNRGLFARTFCKNEFSSIGFHQEFVQFNHSFNKTRGTLRGMHFQHPPYAETKLIRCIQGEVYDVAVDLRRDSPTYLQHFGVILSAENMCSVLIPEGFAHGFQTLTDNATLIYHHTQFYTPQADAGIRHNDPALNIVWPLSVINVSEKDKNYPLIDISFNGITI